MNDLIFFVEKGFYYFQFSLRVESCTLTTQSLYLSLRTTKKKGLIDVESLTHDVTVTVYSPTLQPAKNIFLHKEEESILYCTSLF